VKLSGTATMHAPPDEVWAALTDPAVLAVTIPGCERLEPAGPDAYLFTLTAGVASIRGTYTGDVALSQQREPTSLVLTARCAGGPGTIATSIHITLTEAGGSTTEVSYDAEAAIGGAIAGVGQRMLASVARLLIGDFLTSVDQVLTGDGAAPASLLPAVPGQQPASAAPQPAAAFVGGALVGAAVTLAGVAVRGLIGRRGR
jgi:uncharacterized protein